MKLQILGGILLGLLAAGTGFASGPDVIILQNGKDGYDKCQDTYISSRAATKNYSTDSILSTAC